MDSDSDSGPSVDLTQSLFVPSRPRPRAPREGSNSTPLNTTTTTAASDDDLGSIIRPSSLTPHPSTVKRIKSSAFASLSPLLSDTLLKSLSHRGFLNPTPIQRVAIPHLLSSPPRDLVGMARTGSGKTMAYILPMLARLKAHSPSYGLRALVLAPSRELALQILKVGKDLSRNPKSPSEELRWGLVVGGESIEEQFEMIRSNPDVIIATPGRLLHLVIEMDLDLRKCGWVTFDEADRLFELGFSVQLTELLARLPAGRQTSLFSATLPKSLVEFAKAGLSDPKLVRLDAESKLSQDLTLNFFSVKPLEKEAALLVLLREVIKVPFGQPDISDDDGQDSEDGDAEQQRERHHKRKYSKRKGGSAKKGLVELNPHQTLLFCATKHHVEYLSLMLATAGYSCSAIYGSLDQTARKIQMDRFRKRRTNVLVVTDVAARGIDIPVLENVVNYDMPSSARVFVHRVGRTARAGKTGNAWTMVTNAELPYLLDFCFFLGRNLTLGKVSNEHAEKDLRIGTFPREAIDLETEFIESVLCAKEDSLPALKQVASKGQSLYERTMAKASAESYRRAKDMGKKEEWKLAGSTGVEELSVHSIFTDSGLNNISSKSQDDSEQRLKLLASLSSFTPGETVFEIGQRGQTDGARLMADRRRTMSKSRKRVPMEENQVSTAGDSQMDVDIIPSEMAGEDDLLAAFGQSARRNDRKKARTDYKDPNFYVDYAQKGVHDDRGYSLKDGSSFAEQAKDVQFDLNNDDGIVVHSQKASQITWDRKKKNFVKGGGIGADNKKLIKTESGARLPASFKSGKFDDWKAKKHLDLPRIGEMEAEGSNTRPSGAVDGRRFRHNKISEAKPLDSKHVNYERRVRQEKGKSKAVAEALPNGQQARTQGGGRTLGRFASKIAGGSKDSIKTADQMRKDRKLLAQKKAKNARPSKNGGKGGGRGKPSRR